MKRVLLSHGNASAQERTIWRCSTVTAGQEQANKGVKPTSHRTGQTTDDVCTGNMQDRAQLGGHVLQAVTRADTVSKCIGYSSSALLAITEWEEAAHSIRQSSFGMASRLACI